MPLDPYRRVLALPHVRRLVLVGVLARIPYTAAAVCLTLHVVLTLGRGYGAAGVVGASVTVGMAIGAPWRGRAIDRLGLRRALLPSIVAEALVWGSAPFLSYEHLIAVVFVGGLLGLPVFTVVRQSMSVLVPQAQHRTAFALDSVAVELSFMVGPAIGVLAATQISTRFALLTIGATTVLAGLGLYALNAPTRSAGVAECAPAEAAVTALPASGRRWARLRRRPAAPTRERVPLSGQLVAVLAATAAATIVLAGTDVSIVAHLREEDALGLTGLVVGAWCAASLVGGLVYGATPRALPALVLLLGLAALTAPVGLAPGPLTLCLAVLPAGALCAPVITATSEAIVRLVPEQVRGEAMGWHGSALTGGSAVGAPFAGFAIDRAGPWAGFAAVGGAGVVLAVAGLVLTTLRTRRSAARRTAATSSAVATYAAPARASLRESPVKALGTTPGTSPEASPDTSPDTSPQAPLPAPTR